MDKINKRQNKGGKGEGKEKRKVSAFLLLKMLNEQYHVVILIPL